MARLHGAQGDNGAIGNSPAATGFYLGQTNLDDARALSYLESCLDHSGGATAPVLHPCETFELLWAAYHLFLGGAASQRLLRPPERRRLLAHLAQARPRPPPTSPIP